MSASPPTALGLALFTLFTQTWVLAGSIDSFDAADFTTRLGSELNLPPTMVAVRVLASSVTARANILTTRTGNSTALVGAALRQFARSPSAAGAVLGVTVESVGEPIARELNASQGGGWQRLLNLTDVALQGVLESEIGATLVGTEEAAVDGALTDFLVLLGIIVVFALAVAAVMHMIKCRRKRCPLDRSELLNETVDSSVGKPTGINQNELELSGGNDAPELLPGKASGKGVGRMSVVGLELIEPTKSSHESSRV